jgi:sigma-B regulation protein RsbU (phosphoserine phosphatase)
VTAAVAEVLRRTWDVPPNELGRTIEVVRDVLGADSARVLIADYGLLSLQAMGDDGPVGTPQPIEGSLAGRSLASGELITSGTDPTVVHVPLSDGNERVGILELSHPCWDGQAAALVGPVAQLLVLLLISKRRYTDAIARARRSEPLSTAAEIQWGLLPPLACAAAGVTLSGILEPAYSIGGDSFDYALGPDGVQLAIIDAVGHGMPAVLLSVAALNALRNARREGHTDQEAYAEAGSVIEAQFGESYFVTGQGGSTCGPAGCRGSTPATPCRSSCGTATCASSAAAPRCRWGSGERWPTSPSSTSSLATRCSSTRTAPSRAAPREVCRSASRG